MVQIIGPTIAALGKRRYPDEHDNAMNLGEWLSVTASFSASLPNNHHHFPHFLRTSHDSTEYDFGFLTVRAMKAMPLVKASSSGAQKPEGIAASRSRFLTVRDIKPSPFLRYPGSLWYRQEADLLGDEPDALQLSDRRLFPPDTIRHVLARV